MGKTWGFNWIKRKKAEPEWIDLAAEIVERWEGYAKKLPNGDCEAYPDPGTGGKPWTIGIGSTTDEEGKPIKPGTVWTRERAFNRFKAHLREFGEGVERALDGVPTTPQQKAAMVSLAYNIGLTAFRRSTVLRLHKAGDYGGAQAAFAMWRMAGGRIMRGLVNRRADEMKLYGR